MRRLPSGRVTFLFTDVEGSTRLLDELGEARYAAALADHRSLLRKAFADHGGIEVDTQGDSFFVAFDDAANALRAARDGQAGLAPGPIRVRMGLHTGEPLVTDGGYVGMDVHRGARIAAAGHGGQVLVSDTTRAALADPLELRDLGEQRLKDLGAPIRVYQLGEEDFPPLSVLYRSTLPFQPTPLVGRERELEEAGALLRDHRVLTLTGAGGSGKTRLALQLAAEAADDFPDGVYWVSLQAVRHPSLVIPTVAQAIGSSGDLAEDVGDRRMLVLLDNAEQVVDAAPELAELLAATPNLKLLVTSREALRISGEQRYSVEPLPPEDAVALFLERARAVDTGFEPREAVGQICRRLDGLPLAIELAAARVSLLPPAQLLARLEHALPLLTGGTRDAPERQRTLRATIDWSYQLLAAEERKPFARLAVFAGSFAVETAEEVAGADLHVLQSLVDKSLLRRWGSGRFGMLDTIHEYARERLDESAEAADVFDAHAAWAIALAEAFHDGETAAEALEPDYDNLRAALTWLRGRDPHRHLQLAGALEALWQSRGRVKEGRSELQAAVEQATLDDIYLARALVSLGSIASLQREPAVALDWLRRGLAIWREVGDPSGTAWALESLGYALAQAGDPKAGERHVGEAIALHRQVGDPQALNRAQLWLCQMLVADGEVDRGEPLAAEALATAAAANDVWAEYGAYHLLGDCALIRSDFTVADERYRESLRRAWERGDDVAVGIELQGLAMAAAGLGDDRRALRIGGAADAQLAEHGVTIGGFWSDLLERYLEPVRRKPGSDAMWDDGLSLPAEDAVVEALGR